MSVKMAGQTINDRLLAARHSIAGQGLAKSVCKATTEEMIGPKKKHLDYLIHCTNEPNVSIPQLANLLIVRSQNTNWVVVFKALITVHHMLCYGNERFTQYLASSNSTFQLSNFLDKSGVQGARVGYDMSPFIRRYAKYLNEKALSYRTVAFDFCKVKRGKEDGTLRTMNAEKLLKTLPVLQSQLDSLLEFDCTANDLTNGVINMAFMLLFRDLIRLFACYNDGIINLLEKYFDMNKKQCRDALDLYKKFLIRMDRVAEFLKVAENVGIDKGDIPDLTKAPSSLLDALEQHLASLEGKKGSAANTPTQTASNRTNVKSGVSALSSTSTAFGTAAANTRLDSHANGIDESLKQQVLAEEEAAMNQYKAKVSSPSSTAPSTNPFLSSPTGTGAAAAQQPIVDLFGSPTSTTGDASQPPKASDDLLQLSGNPFADMFAGVPQAAPVPAAPATQDMWLSNGFRTAPPAGGAFVSDQSFSSVFGSSDAGSAATAGMAAPNPFMSDFSPAPGGGQHVTPASASTSAGPPPLATTSSSSSCAAAPAPAQGMVLFEEGGSRRLPQDAGVAAADLFDADFGAVGQAAAGQPVPAAAAADLFGDVSAAAADAEGFEDGQASGDPDSAGKSQQFPSTLGSFPSPAGKLTSPPPPRPPPPAGAGGTSRAVSPIPASGSPGRPPPPVAMAAAAAASKSAFDDLNDSIRAALGGSPTRPPPPPAGSLPPHVAAAAPGFGISAFPGGFDVAPSQALVSGGGGGGGLVFGQPPPPSNAPIGYGSPAKQGLGMTGFDVLQPIQPHGGGGGVSAMGSVGTMAMGAAQQPLEGAGKVLTGDLDSSLASLAQNLSINKGGQGPVKGVQWNSPKNAAKPGATGWTPQPMAATTGAGYRPMGQGMAAMGYPAHFPAGTPIMGMQAMATMRPMGSTTLMGGPAMMGGGTTMLSGPRIGTPAAQPLQQPSAQPLDPFGAL